RRGSEERRSGKSVRAGGSGTVSGRAGGSTGRAGSGICLNIEFVQFVGIKLKLGLRFQNHVILIQLRVHGVDLALAEGVIQSVVDRRGCNTKPRSRGAV